MRILTKKQERRIEETQHRLKFELFEATRCMHPLDETMGTIEPGSPAAVLAARELRRLANLDEINVVTLPSIYLREAADNLDPKGS